MQPTIKILIVEDEVLIAETIRLYLKERGYMTTDLVISYNEAILSINNNKPDIALIDIRLFGQQSGIELAATIQQEHAGTAIIFITSQYDERILQKALELNPNGYLVKPIQKESLWTTVELAYARMNSLKEADAIRISDGTKTYYLQNNQIKYISADHIYSIVYTTHLGELTLRLPLNEIINLLNSENFIRCHRSFIVNKRYVSHYDTNVFYIDKTVIPISRSNKAQVKKAME
jgi:DNA-binding LytR/AlgR family response regulator